MAFGCRYNRVPISDLTKILPYVSFETVILGLTGKPLSDSVLLRSPNYLAAVNGILEKKSNEVIQAYLTWTTMRYFIGHTDAATREDFVNKCAIWD